jgi:hypothetical protein
MPEPLTPPDCDLTDFQRMMIDIPRLRGSDFDATLDDPAWRAGINLWLSSWHQVPAASLTDDEVADQGRRLGSRYQVVAARAGLIALRGWVRCDDGLLYHPVVAEFALEAWLAKLSQALSSGAGNAKRWKVEFDPSPVIEAEIERTAEMLRRLNPKSKALTKLERRVKAAIPRGCRRECRWDRKAVPAGCRKRPVGIARERDRERESKNPPSPRWGTATGSGW